MVSTKESKKNNLKRLTRVFRDREISIRIHWIMDPDPVPNADPAFFFGGFKIPTKNIAFFEVFLFITDFKDNNLTSHKVIANQ
jgi:hypothetical protein